MISIRTYVKINGELSKYPIKKYHYQERIKKPKCDICHGLLTYIHTLVDFKRLKIGYFCKNCKIGFLNKTKGKFFQVEIIEPKRILNKKHQ